MQPAIATTGALLYALPMIVLFTISQKYIGEAYRLGLGKA